MKAIISLFISLLFSFFVVFFTNITNTLAFRELAVAHGISVTFVLVFLAIVTISFVVIVLLYILYKLVINELEYSLSTTIDNHSKYIKDSIVEYLVKHYTSLFNKVETIKVYNNNTISLITTSHDILEHKLDKLLALSNSPANQLIDRVVLPKPVVMKAVEDVYDDYNDDLVVSKDEEITVFAIYLDSTYNSGLAYETSKGLIDMGLLIN